MADSTQGHDPPEGSQGTTPPQGADVKPSITLEDVNKAITARFSSYEKKLDTKFLEFGKGLETSLGDALASKLAEHAQPRKPEGQQSTGNIEEDPRFRSLQKQLSELKNARETDRREVEIERAKAADVRLRQQLGEMLVAQGIDGARTKHAVGFLVDVEKRVRFDDNANIVFAEQNGEALDGPTGLKAWLATEDAKLYLPPRGAAGSGERPKSNGTGNASSDPNADAKAALMQHFGIG